MTKYGLLLLTALTLLGGCAVNPVTGEKELSLVSEAQELNIGTQQYAPLRQAQGGDYVVDKALTAYVSEVGQKLAAVSDRKLPYEFHVLNNSVPNAWALPGGKIVLNRGLLTELGSEAELAAVLGHEITHAAAKHTVRSMSRGMLLQGAMMATVLATQSSDYAQVAQLGAGLGAQLITKKYGRDAEREADYYGMKYMSRAGYNTQGAVELQQTFVKLSEGRKQNWMGGLFASHPPSQERVQNNIQTLSKFPATGETGQQRFQTKIAHLKKTKPAYEAYDKGRAALAKGDVKAAQKFANQAYKQEPREAHFVSLLGDIEQKNDNKKAALKYYNQAIKLNSNFFYYHLKKGITQEQLGNRQQAKQALENSIKLLPTANAYNSLGNIARKERRFDQAKDYYAKASRDKSATGKQAFGALVELDLADNPSKYLKVKLALDQRGRTIASVTNNTPKPIRGITVGAQYTDNAGHQRRAEFKLRKTLQPGKSASVNLRLNNPDKATKQSLRAQVVEAGIAR